MENSRSHNFKDLTGQKFHQLVVKSLHETRSVKSKGTIWVCLCSCGQEKLIRGQHLVSGGTKSCGCLAKKLASERAQARIGPKNHWWRGGRAISTDGYVKIYTPEHPRTQNGIYVYEHTLVMEKALNRYLLPEETVHHKNGDKQDNRIENLELWASNHGGGQRIQDQINWALSILKSYAPEYLNTSTTDAEE